VGQQIFNQQLHYLKTMGPLRTRRPTMAPSRAPTPSPTYAPTNFPSPHPTTNLSVEEGAGGEGVGNDDPKRGLKGVVASRLRRGEPRATRGGVGGTT
jgi:hypothetical protein